MLKHIFKATRISTAILLVVSVLTPATVAEATGTITKQVTVYGQDGQPYAGAWVSLGYTDPSNQGASPFTPPVQTNSSGIAQLTFADNLTGGEIWVEPLVTDTATAAVTLYDQEYANNSSVRVDLPKADLAINLLNGLGSAASAGGGMSNGFRNTQQKIFRFNRTGAVGIAYDSGLATDTCNKLTVFSADVDSQEFARRYAVKITGTGSSRSVKMYDDFLTCTQETRKVNGVYQFSLKHANVSGYLKTNAGGSLSIGPGEGYIMTRYQKNSDGTNNYTDIGVTGYIENNGAWYSYIDTAVVGTNEISFNGFGNTSFTTFGGNKVYVTNDHKLSWYANGSSSADTLTKDFNIPLKNVEFNLIDSATSTLKSIDVSIQKKIGSTTNYAEYSYSFSNNGIVNAALEDGDYKVNIQPNTTYDFNVELFISVSGSTVTLTRSSAYSYGRTGNKFTVWKPVANVKIKLVDTSGNPVSGFTGGCTDDGLDCFKGATNSAGEIDLIGNNGDYPNLLFDANNSDTVANTRLVGRVVNGVFSLDNSTQVAGRWVVTLPNGNFRARIVHPTTGETITAAYMTIYASNSSWAQVVWENSRGTNANGLINFKLADGRYLGILNVISEPTAVEGLSEKKFQITVTGGVPTVAYEGAAINAVSGTFNLAPLKTNLDLIVKDANGALITSGNIELWDTTSNGSSTTRTNPRWLTITSTGHAYALVKNGTQTITVRPGSTYTNSAIKIFSITTANDAPTVTGGTQSGNAWVVVAPAPRIRAVVKNSTTNTPLANAWIEVQNSNDNWEQLGWVYNLDIGPNDAGLTRANLPNGKYLFIVNPSDTVANAGLAAQTYRVSINDTGTTVSLGASAITAVDGVFPLNPASSNFDTIAKKANGTAFSNGWIEYCKTDANGKRTTCSGVWLRTDGSQSRFLTDGTWQVILHPGSGLSDVTEKVYNVVVTSGVAAVTGLTIGGDNKWTLLMGSPNISGSYSTSAGPVVFSGDMGISLQIQKKDTYGNWQWQSGGVWSNSNAWALNLTGAGQYRLVANPYNFNDIVQSFSSDIWVNSSNQLSLTQNGTYTDSLTAQSILMKSPNLKLQVVNPLNNDALVAGGWVEIQKITSNCRCWVGNADISASNPGITGYNIAETGNYILKVNPPQGNMAIAGVASREYNLTVSALDSMTVTLGGTPVALSNGRFVLSLAAANVSARIMRPDGTAAVNSNNTSYYVNVQKLNQWNNWEWISKGASVDQNGYVSFRIDVAGKYRLRIEPYNDATASVTYSSEFTVTDSELNTFDKKFGNITMNPPSLRVSVATPGAPSTILSNINVEVRKDGNWIDWAYTGQSGIAGITLTAEGNYELVPNPSQELQGTNTRKSYKFTATKNSDGLIVATPVVADGASTDANGVVKLLLGLPTLTGTVKDPTGTTLQANSQVWAQNALTGQDMWEYSTNTNQQGAWSMMLPAGTYKIYANAPWGTSEFGKSSPIGDVVVASNGTATVPAGYAANNFVIKLKAPTWSGTIKDPTGTSVIPQGRVCLYTNGIWNCTNADSVGHWALSMSDSFTSFTNTNPILDLSDDMGRAYPMKRIQGETAVSTALGAIGSTNVDLRLQAPNVQITVTTPDSTKIASNLWVVAERDGVGYLGSGTTDATGLAKLNIPNPTQPFKIRVDVNGNNDINQNFAPLMQTFSSDSITAGTNNGIFSATVLLPTPNFKFIVREPNTAGTAVPYAWVELLSGNDGPWLGGASSDANGFAHFKLDVPASGLVNNYTVTVNPQWSATTNWTRQAYAVAVASNGNITVVNKTSVTSVSTQVASGKTVYPLLLGTPSVTGVVVDPSNNGVRDSWVVPINASTNEYYYQQSIWSRQNGQIAMNLAAGSYKLEANVPWGTSGLAKSAKCAVTVAGGTITTGGDCVVAGTPNTVKLQLRLPNVKFTLKVGSTPIANANVSVGAGNWWTNAQSNDQGVVSLFIDADAIRAANPNATGAQRLYLSIDPPYGSSTMARWNCYSGEANKPLCKDLADVPATGNYVDNVSPSWVVQGVQPNTRLKIVVPSTTTELPNSWVVVYGMNSNGYKWWLGGGNSGNDGYVAMNLETATAFSNGYNKLVVEVNAPWNERSKYATSEYTYNGLGYTFESLTAVLNFSPALPNLTLKIKGANNYDNRYGWYAVQEIDSSNNYIRWVGGYGLNETGDGAVYLAGNKRYRVTAYPGGGRPGVQTSCILTTNSATPVAVSVVSCEGTNSLVSTVLTLRLAGGNVVGTILDSAGNPLVGAAVYANQPGAATEASAIVTVTDETGHYDLQLKGGLQWTIKVFPIPSDTMPLTSKTIATAFTAPNTGQPTVTKDFSYVTP